MLNALSNFVLGSTKNKIVDESEESSDDEEKLNESFQSCVSVNQETKEEIEEKMEEEEMTQIYSSAESAVSSITGFSAESKTTTIEPSLFSRRDKGGYVKVYNRTCIPAHQRYWKKAVDYYFDGDEETAFGYRKSFLDLEQDIKDLKEEEKRKG
jgi:hypothetical protein